MLQRFLPALALLLLASAAQAQDPDLRRIVLINGDVYVGYVEDESADPVVVRTRDGVQRSFPRSQVELVAPLIKGRFFRTDPVSTRLVVAPTARTMGGGEVRGDLTGFYPSVTAGLTDRVDLLATGFLSFGSDGIDGGGITPLLGVKGQVYATESVQVALGASALFVIGADDGAFGAIPYAVATFGDEVRSVSVGAGGLVGGASGEFDIASGLLYGIGAETQINNGVKLFVETLGLAGSGDGDVEVGLLVMPGVRLFGERFAFDIIGVFATDFDAIGGFAPIPARLSYTF